MAGQLKLQRHRTHVQKQKQPAQQPTVEYSSESEAESEDQFGDMLDDEEQQYLMSRLSKQPTLLANIPENEKPGKRSRKRKREKKEKFPKPTVGGSDSGAESAELSDSDSDVEGKYEKEQAERPAKKMRPLLPIKTKEGQQTQKQSEDEGSESDSGMEGTEDVEMPADEEKVVTAVELLAARRNKLQHDKLRIGALCSSLLENPEKKLKNLYPILYLMEDRLKDGSLNLVSVRKLATVSAFEVFKDILPEYMIRHQDYSNIKCKKVDEHTMNLALVSLRCMCGLLVARPHFNYATNIAQSVIPHLDCKDDRARSTVTECCTNVFAEDNKGDITLIVVRLINQLVKRRNERLDPSALDCLLTLKIRDIDMDAEAEIKNKKKQEEKHKKRIVNLSKKEKKRAKKLKEVERELLETQAQESEMARRKQMTEVTKTVFHIYFRLLKTAPRSKLLAAALNGLAKFTHVINLEYYSDLVAILARLISDELIGARERLLCVRTVLAVLAGAGDALNVDPAKFHAYLYQSKAVSTLLEADSEAGGSGRFDPTLPSPEHCNAHAAGLHELCVLARHYHPTVRSAATLLLKGSLPSELNKM
ncbi:hypothetical protein HF086_011167 [Spodoptera exigua]|uniref:NOC3-like protein n=1 Tax=Spodoptera exigua TaxID=7107 RepID=A0A922SMF0_SPOEX|nr:hypothetical protein HF086_011167 [Spodoptera exigua]